MRASSLGLVLLAACGGNDSSTQVPGVDPIELAGQVSQSELTETIQGLEDLGTRYTVGDGDDRAKDYLVDRIEAMGLTAELDPFTAGAETANNIIVKHPGTVEPDVIYMFSAHYDSTSETPDTAAPGADDNASGVAAVLEAMRLMTPHAFRHTVWFVLTAAEEQGSLGSAHLVEELAADGTEVAGAIAPDMIGYWPLGDDDLFDILGDADSAALVEHMADVATRLGVAHKTYLEHAFCYGDDHTNYQEAGIPSITPMDCVEAHNVVSSSEDTPHYHRTTDTLDTLHMPFTTKVAGVILATLAELAEPAPAAR